MLAHYDYIWLRPPRILRFFLLCPDTPLLWIPFKFKLRLPSYRQSYSTSVTKLPSSDRSFQLGHLRSRKPPSQTLKSSIDKHTSSTCGFLQLGPNYRLMAKQLVTLPRSSTTSTSTLTPTFKLWCFLSCLKPTRRPMTTIQSSTSLHASTTTRTSSRRRRTSYIPSNKAMTPCLSISPSLSVPSMRLVAKVRTTSTKYPASVMALIQLSVAAWHNNSVCHEYTPSSCRRFNSLRLGLLLHPIKPLLSLPAIQWTLVS